MYTHLGKSRGNVMVVRGPLNKTAPLVKRIAEQAEEIETLRTERDALKAERDTRPEPTR